MELLAKIAIRILKHLHTSESDFVEICAKDFDIDDYTLFARQLDAMRIEKLVDRPPRQEPINLTILTFEDEIKSIDTKVTVGITVKGVKELRSLLPI